MLYLLTKALVSGILIAIISTVSARHKTIGAVLASFPLVSILGFAWMRFDRVDTEKIAALSQSVFWLVLPSLFFFPLFAWLLRKNSGFGLSLAVSLTVMIAGYFALLALFGCKTMG